MNLKKESLLCEFFGMFIGIKIIITVGLKKKSDLQLTYNKIIS